MTTPHQPVAVGAEDPDLKTSPILEEGDEEFDVLAQEVDDLPSCYFNNTAYPDGTSASFLVDDITIGLQWQWRTATLRERHVDQKGWL